MLRNSYILINTNKHHFRIHHRNNCLVHLSLVLHQMVTKEDYNVCFYGFNQIRKSERCKFGLFGKVEH